MTGEVNLHSSDAHVGYQHVVEVFLHYWSVEDAASV